MDKGRVTSLGTCTQSIEICILLVNNDLICRNIVLDMLQNCNHEAYDYEKPMDALDVIRGRREKVELVMTNVERTNANRFGIIEYIEKEFKLRVALMRPDGNMNILSRGIESGVTVYMVKCSSLNEIKILWENALARERGKMVTKEYDSHQMESFLENSSDSAVTERTKVHRKREMDENEESSEQDEDSRDDSKAEKKARVQWNDEMHRKFLEAIAQLGHERAFPKKIVEVMNIPGLTREHVASHLQKHRMNLKKTQENLNGSFYGRTSINDLKEPFFPSSHSAPLSYSFQRGSRSTFPVLPFYRTSFYPDISIGKSRIGPGQSFSLNNQGKLNLSYNKQNFRVYGDQTKNVLLNVGNTNAESGFVGLRLTNDGKSVEIGQKGNIGSIGNNEQVSSFPLTHGIMNSLQYPAGNFELYPSPNLPPLEKTGIENDCQLWSLPPPLEFNGNENLDHYPFSSLSLLLTDVEENSYHCPSLPVDLSPLQQYGNENSDNYLVQQHSPTQFESFGEVNSDIDHLTFIDCSTLSTLLEQEPSISVPGEESSVAPLQEPSISVPGEEGSVAPLQLDELDCFRVSEDIDIDYLVGENTRSLTVEDFENILFDQED